MLRSLHNYCVQYRIAQNFGSRKHWRIWRLGANSPKFYPPKFSITLVFYRCSTQSANVFSITYILGANPPRFSTAKVLCSTVHTTTHLASRTVLAFAFAALAPASELLLSPECSASSLSTLNTLCHITDDNHINTVIWLLTMLTILHTKWYENCFNE